MMVIIYLTQKQVNSKIMVGKFVTKKNKKMKHLSKFNEGISKETWNRQELEQELINISKSIFTSFNDEEFNEIKMRNEYGHQKGIAIDIWVNNWILKNI